MSAGFGFTNKVNSKPFAITVSDQMDYEISFWFKQPNRLPTFEVSVDCFDCQFQVQLKTINIQNGAYERALLPGNLPICSLENKWNFWHGIVYSCNEPLHNSEDPLTSHAAGNNLRMQKNTAKMFVNFICVDNCVLIYDFKVKPLRTPFSTGFIQNKSLIEVWRKNNKKDMTQSQIDALANEFLVPYDGNLSVINI